MRITNQSLPEATQVVESSKNKAKTDGETARVRSAANSTSSTVEISDNARLMRSASEQVRNIKDSDDSKIERLRGLIESGNYRVPADKIADRLIDEHLKTDFGKNNL